MVWCNLFVFSVVLTMGWCVCIVSGCCLMCCYVVWWVRGVLLCSVVGAWSVVIHVLHAVNVD